MYGNHQAVERQQMKFGYEREEIAFDEQIVVLKIKGASDTRAWHWDDVLGEPDVELVGWSGHRRRVKP